MILEEGRQVYGGFFGRTMYFSTVDLATRILSLAIFPTIRGGRSGGMYCAALVVAASRKPASVKGRANQPTSTRPRGLCHLFRHTSSTPGWGLLLERSRCMNPSAKGVLTK